MEEGQIPGQTVDDEVRVKWWLYRQTNRVGDDVESEMKDPDLD